MSSFLIIVKNSSILMYTYATVIYVMLYVICYICYMLYVIYKILYCNCVKMCKVALSINKVYLIWFDLYLPRGPILLIGCTWAGPSSPFPSSWQYCSSKHATCQAGCCILRSPALTVLHATREKKGDHSNKNIIVHFSQRISLYCPAEQNLQGTTEKTWVK